MDAAKRENLITTLKNAVESLIKERPSAYDRCVDITGRLFCMNDHIVLVMNRDDYTGLSNIRHQYDITFIDGVGIMKNFQTQYGTVEYLIVDDKVKDMYGYIK